MHAANLSLIFISFSVIVQYIDSACTLDKAIRARAHYKHAAISKVFIVAC